MKRNTLVLVVVAAILPPAVVPVLVPAQERAAPPHPMSFVWPCDGYLRGLGEGGGFGILIGKDRGPPFGGTWHLAEDVRLPARTPVVSVAPGRVMYSDFSPTWRGEDGVRHWNFGNVIVIEHPLLPPEGALTHVCSVYVHLAKDRKVAAGDAVDRGQPIGSIGAGGSHENGGYPVHLHFGIHRGPYFQVAPSWRREMMDRAATVGLPVDDPPTGAMRLVKGEPTMERLHESAVVFRFPNLQLSVMSLLTGSTAPRDKPADIMHWCQGYGSQDAVAEWLKPSEWIREHLDRRR